MIGSTCYIISRPCSSNPFCQDLQVCSQRGLLGVLPHGSLSLKDMEADYGVKFAELVKKSLLDFCTPLGAEQPDMALYRRIVASTVAVFGDGAILKAMSFLREALPAAFIIARDTCHVQRIATGEPIKRDGLFGERWKLIFAGQGGLFPAIQASAAYLQKKKF